MLTDLGFQKFMSGLMGLGCRGEIKLQGFGIAGFWASGFVGACARTLNSKQLNSAIRLRGHAYPDCGCMGSFASDRYKGPKDLVTSYLDFGWVIIWEHM